nr:transcriptional regulator [Rhodoplanes elegans]
MPAWVQALAEEANRTSGAAAAARIGYSPPVVSQVLSRTYPGDLARIQEKVAGALMGVTVECPVLGDIARDRCLDEQAKGFAATSSVRARLYRACRAGCPHSRLKGEAG